MCPKKDGKLVVDFADEVVRGATVVQGTTRSRGRRPRRSCPRRRPKPAAAARDGRRSLRRRSLRRSGRSPRWSSAALALFGVGAVAPPAFLAHFTVFVLACFVGYMVVWNVTPGAAHAADERHERHQQHHHHRRAPADQQSDVALIMWMAALTVLITSINIAGGFAVTRRMLEMFRK